MKQITETRYNLLNNFNLRAAQAKKCIRYDIQNLTWFLIIINIMQQVYKGIDSGSSCFHLCMLDAIMIVWLLCYTAGFMTFYIQVLKNSFNLNAAVDSFSSLAAQILLSLNGIGVILLYPVI